MLQQLAVAAAVGEPVVVVTAGDKDSVMASAVEEADAVETVVVSAVVVAASAVVAAVASVAAAFVALLVAV